jgi:hypothetical protein
VSNTQNLIKNRQNAVAEATAPSAPIALPLEISQSARHSATKVARYVHSVRPSGQNLL